LEQGKLSETVSVIVRGKVRVTRDGRVLGDLIAGDFVGSALILSGIPAEVDAVTVEPGRAMRWEVGVGAVSYRQPRGADRNAAARRS
jgi:CRP-like cAMP-binding protein